MTDSACLTGETAAVYVSNDVKLTNGFGNTEGLVNDELEGIKTKVIVNISAVDGDSAGTGVKANSCNGLLSSTCSVEIRFSTGIQSTNPPY